ncbi:hypothetical protein niasHS_015734 [Heterodera schachtii]|uniref:Uncharacterized protein n=1 Tax=Heterodera schachtii TaxID=97005 RepID=A0ABD2HY72_HETSC
MPSTDTANFGIGIFQRKVPKMEDNVDMNNMMAMAYKFFIKTKLFCINSTVTITNVDVNVMPTQAWPHDGDANAKTTDGGRLKQWKRKNGESNPNWTITIA